MELTLFSIVAAIAVIAAVGMLLSQNAVHSALFLIVNFGCVAFLFLLLDAAFLSMVQIVVYTGAIMVLFLFVIMLLGAEQTTDIIRQSNRILIGATLLALAFLLLVGAPLAANVFDLDKPVSETAMLRVVHAATDAMTVDAVIPDVDEESLDGLTFGEASHFVTLPTGETTLSINAAETGTSLIETSFQLGSDEAYTLVVYGSGGALELGELTEDFSPVGEGEGRLVIYNTLDAGDLSLVDTGQFTDVDSLVDASGNPSIGYRTVIADLPFGAQQFVDLDDHQYNLALVNSEQEVVRSIPEVEIENGTVSTMVVALEPAQPGTEPRLVTLQLGDAQAAASFGSPEAIGQVLFVEYLLPVQLVGVLLLVALISVIVLARPETLLTRERRVGGRRRVSRSLVSVISSQTGQDVLQGAPQLDPPTSGD